MTIREQAEIGNNVSIGTLSDLQGHCKLGNYVRLHSNVHIGMLSQIDDCVWIFPYVVLTNDPTPPSENEFGVHIHSFAVVATNAILLPGVEVHNDALIGAGAIVTKDVDKYEVAVGNPAKVKGDVRNINEYAEFNLDLTLEGNDFLTPKVKARIVNVIIPKNVEVNIIRGNGYCIKRGHEFNIKLNDANYTRTVEYDTKKGYINITNYINVEDYSYTLEMVDIIGEYMEVPLELIVNGYSRNFTCVNNTKKSHAEIKYNVFGVQYNTSTYVFK